MNTVNYCLRKNKDGYDRSGNICCLPTLKLLFLLQKPNLKATLKNIIGYIEI